MSVLDHSRPFYKVEVNEADASEPKLVFSPNIFLDTERPSGQNSLSSEAYVTHITVNSKLVYSVNTCDIEIRHGIGAAINIDIEDEVKVYFGFYDQDKSQGPDFSLAHVGYVNQIKNGLEKTIITCKSSLNKITKKKIKIAFAKTMGIDEIIKKLAIEIGELEEASGGVHQPGIDVQPGFAISETNPIIDHLSKLAKYSAYYLFMDAFDKLHALGWDPSALQDAPSGDDPLWISARDKTESENTNFYKHSIIFDKKLLDINFEIVENKYSGVEVVGLFPFSDDPTHTIEPIKVEYRPDGQEDSEKPLLRFKVSHVTREHAELIAENLYWSVSGQVSGSLKLLSAPQIRVNDGIVFEGEIYEQLPFGNIKFNDGSSDKDISEITFQVSEVQHKFDTVEGFITIVKLVIAHTPAGVGAAGASAEEEEGAAEEEEEPEDQEVEVEEEEGEAVRRLVVVSRTKSGKKIPNAPFVLIKPDGEEIRAETDENGEYVFEDLPPGSYQVRFLTADELVEEEEGEGGGGLADAVGDALGGFL